MSDLDEVEALDAGTFTSMLGESVTYVKRSGATRTINAVVNREPVVDEGGALVHAIFVEVRNSLTAGVALSELDGGGDKIRLAPRRGQAVESFALTPQGLLSQDAGMLRFRLR